MCAPLTHTPACCCLPAPHPQTEPACSFACCALQENLTPFARQCVSELAPRYRMELFQVGGGFLRVGLLLSFLVGKVLHSASCPLPKKAVPGKEWAGITALGRAQGGSEGRVPRQCAAAPTGWEDLITSCRHCRRVPVGAGASGEHHPPQPGAHPHRAGQGGQAGAAGAVQGGALERVGGQGCAAAGCGLRDAASFRSAGSLSWEPPSP